MISFFNRSQLIPIVLPLLAVCNFAVTSIGQEVQAQLPTRLVRCDTTYSIEFVKAGVEESEYSFDGDERIWLRFRNLSAKTLKIRARDDQKTLDFVMQKGIELGMYYDVVNKYDCKSEETGIPDLPPGYTRREAYNIIELRPQQAFTFSVPARFLSSGRAVYITYECFRKCNRGEKGQIKRAYFFSSQLPKKS